MFPGVLISQRDIRLYIVGNRIIFLFASKCKTILQECNERSEVVLVCQAGTASALHFNLPDVTNAALSIG